MLFAAANPCHCGYHGSSLRVCRCTPAMLERYRARLSGPLIDRFDMHIELAAIKPEELITEETSNPSERIAKRVEQARNVQLSRQGKLNSELTANELEQQLKSHKPVLANLARLAESLTLTARSFHRTLRLARTIADCNGESIIKTGHINEALHYRSLDRRR